MAGTRPVEPSLNVRNGPAFSALTASLNTSAMTGSRSVLLRLGHCSSLKAGVAREPRTQAGISVPSSYLCPAAVENFTVVPSGGASVKVKRAVVREVQIPFPGMAGSVVMRSCSVLTLSAGMADAGKSISRTVSGRSSVPVE